MTTEQSTRSTIADRVRDFGITAKIKRFDRNPHMGASDDWNRTASHWRITLRVQSRRMTLYFSQGSALTDPPTATDALNALAMDAAGYENARSFEDWCSEYGYDIDSRRAERTYKTVERQTDKLRRLIEPLGATAYQNLLWHTETL